MNRLLLPIAAVLAMTLASCEQMEMCHHHPHSHVLNICSDWQRVWEYRYDGPDWKAQWDDAGFQYSYDDLCPAVPEGLRAVIYRPDGQVESVNTDNSGGELMMQKGTSSILFYNNDTEYIVFNDFDSSMMASATTRTRTRSTYLGSPYSAEEEEYTVNAPDMLYGYYIKEYETDDDNTSVKLAITMRPLVFTYIVRFHFDQGMQYVALARGALAGMARSVYLFDGHTSTDKASVLFDCESAAEQLQETGNTITVLVNTFGAPNFPNPYYDSTRGDVQCGLNLEVRLTNGKIFSFDFDVTEQVQSQPRGGVIDVCGIAISDDDGKEASGQFGVDVNDWGDFEDVPLDLSSENLKN